MRYVTDVVKNNLRLTLVYTSDIPVSLHIERISKLANALITENCEFEIMATALTAYSSQINPSDKLKNDYAFDLDDKKDAIGTLYLSDEVSDDRKYGYTKINLDTGELDLRNVFFNINRSEIIKYHTDNDTYSMNRGNIRMIDKGCVRQLVSISNNFEYNSPHDRYSLEHTITRILNLKNIDMSLKVDIKDTDSIAVLVRHLQIQYAPFYIVEINNKLLACRDMLHRT